MRIALYYPWLYLTSGVERTILETIKRSEHKYTIFTNHYDKKNTYPDFKDLKIVKLEKVPVKRDVLSVLKAAFVISRQKIDLDRFDLLLVHSEGLGDLVLFNNASIPSICFCYTPLRPVFDKDYRKRVSNRKNIIEIIFFYLFSIIFKTVDRQLWKRYIYIFFISKESRRRSEVGGLLDKDMKYQILHPGIDWYAAKPNWNYDKYFIVPGRIMWTKNIELAVKAFKIFSRISKDKGFKLIVAGQVDQKSKTYFKSIKRIAKGNRVKFVLNPSDTTMKRLYKNCWAAICPAFNEDWGLTAIEANLYGKPVLAVNSGGFKESQIDQQTGFLLKLDAKDFALKMFELSMNKKLTIKMGENARQNVKKYSWQKTIQGFDKKIIDILNHNKS